MFVNSYWMLTSGPHMESNEDFLPCNGRSLPKVVETIW